MAKITWDDTGKRFYELGVDHCVLYPQAEGKYPKGVAWNGIVSIAESPSGAEDNAFYADNIKYLNIKSAEDLSLTIGCYTYPDEWEACDGHKQIVKGVTIGQQSRQLFGLSYRTKKGNDTEGQDYGYIIHLVYGCSASPSESTYESINESPEPIQFSYEVSTTPVPFEGFKPAAMIEIDSKEVAPEILTKLEKALYGSDEELDGSDPQLPMPSELLTLLGIGG